MGALLSLPPCGSIKCSGNRPVVKGLQRALHGSHGFANHILVHVDVAIYIIDIIIEIHTTDALELICHD